MCYRKGLLTLLSLLSSSLSQKQGPSEDQSDPEREATIKVVVNLFTVNTILHQA